MVAGLSINIPFLASALSSEMVLKILYQGQVTTWGMSVLPL